MEKENLYRELYNDREIVINIVNPYGFESHIALASTEEYKKEYAERKTYEGLENYFDYLNRINSNSKKRTDYYIKLLENDCKDMRKLFVKIRIKEADSKNKVVCALSLINEIKYLDKTGYSLNIKEFMYLLESTSQWNYRHYRMERDKAYEEIQNIREIEEIKKYVLDKIEQL